MIDYQMRDEQTMDSLQPRDLVVDKRAEPDEKDAADSSMFCCRSAHPDEFIVLLDDPNQEIAEQWQDGKTGTHVETPVSVQSRPPESPVVSPSSEVAASSVRVSGIRQDKQPDIAAM